MKTKMSWFLCKHKRTLTHIIPSTKNSKNWFLFRHLHMIKNNTSEQAFALVYPAIKLSIPKFSC